jgi:phosphonopyruvate decarboxylase
MITKSDLFKFVVNKYEDFDCYVTTTGFTSREFYDLSLKSKDFPPYFLTIGGMGHASSIALGMSKANSKLRVFCFDGDGASLMHMGAMATIGRSPKSRIIHLILNNFKHESVGGQPTFSEKVDYRQLASSLGYSKYFMINSISDIEREWESIRSFADPILIEVRTEDSQNNNLIRPKETPLQLKTSFMRKLKT